MKKKHEHDFYIHGIYEGNIFTNTFMILKCNTCYLELWDECTEINKIE